MHQIQNLYGRCVLTALLFCITDYFPPKDSLNKFGYTLQDDKVTFNLDSSHGKEKNVRVMLAGIIKKGNIDKEIDIDGNKKRTLLDKGNKAKKISKRRKQNVAENLID